MPRLKLFRRGEKGESDAERGAIYDVLHRHKEEIEEAFGSALVWDRRAGELNWRIGKRIELGGYRDEDRWAEIQDAMISEMMRLDGAPRPFFNVARALAPSAAPDTGTAA